MPNLPSQRLAALVRDPAGRLRVAVAMVSLLVVASWVCGAFWLWSGRQQALEAQSLHNANLVRALEEQTYRTLSSADALVRSAVTAVELGRAETLATLAVEKGAGHAVQRLTYFDADGVIRYSSAHMAGTDMSASTTFKVALSALNRTVIGKPIFGTVGRSWMIPVIRAVQGSDGRFAGGVVVAIDPFYFTGLYAELDNGRKGNVTLMTSEGQVLARYVGGASSIPRDDERLKPPPPVGVTELFQRTSSVDAIERLYAVRHVRDFDVAVGIGTALDEIYAPLVPRERLIMILVAALSGGLLAALAYMYRDAKRIQVAARAAEEARASAEAASAAKSTFLAHMSHEIRTPLATILGIVDVVEAEGTPPRVRDRMVALRRTALSLKQLLDDVLDFSRLEARGPTIVSAPLSPAEVLNDACEPFRVMLEHRDVTLRLDVPPTLPRRVRGDEARLRQVLFNLVGNAVKFTERGAIVVSAWSSEEGHRLHFRVADTGIGVTKETLDELFQPFSPASLATAQRYGGTGLGLAICRRLIEAMGGAITAHGSPDEGATFEFDVKVEPLPDVEAPAPRVASPSPQPVRRALRVLLAEDNKLIREVEKEMLGSFGHHVTAVAGGWQTLAALRSGTYDILLLDRHMPDLDGEDLARLIRVSEQPWSTLPIVIVSADANPADRRVPEVDAFVPKPVDWNVLSALMGRLVAERSASDEAPVEVMP